MLFINNGYCIEAEENYWSTPAEEEVSHMEFLDPRQLASVENHSGQGEVVIAGLGDIATRSV